MKQFNWLMATKFTTAEILFGSLKIPEWECLIDCPPLSSTFTEISPVHYIGIEKSEIKRSIYYLSSQAGDIAVGHCITVMFTIIVNQGLKSQKRLFWVSIHIFVFCAIISFEVDCFYGQ